MKDSEIEKRLKQESDAHTPDLLEKIRLAAREEGLLEETVPAMPSGRRKTPRPARSRSIFRRLTAALVAAACCLAVILPVALSAVTDVPSAPDVPAYTTICMKINPAVEFKVEGETVTQVRALNTDAAVLLVDSRTTLTGVSPEEACLTFAEMAQRSGRIGENGVTVYVGGKDEEEWESRIESTLSSFVTNIGGKDYEETAKKLSEKYSVTLGKARIAAELLANDPSLSEKKLMKMSLEDLYERSEDYREEEMERYQAELKERYESEYDQFLTDTLAPVIEKYEGLLNGYIADLSAMDGTDREAIDAFNQRYAELGEDFYIEYEHNKDWEREREKYLRRAEEAKRELQEDPLDFLEDLKLDEYKDYEDFLDDFKDKNFSPKGGKEPAPPPPAPPAAPEGVGQPPFYGA